MKQRQSIIHLPSPIFVPRTIYKVGTLVRMPYDTPIWERLWYLLLWKNPPTEYIFEVTAVDEVKVSLKFLYRV